MKKPGNRLILQPRETLRFCVRFLIILLLAQLTWTATARAEEPSISATLSSVTASPGEPVELQITIQGSEKSDAPQVRADGLDIQYHGASTQIQMNNFDVSRSVKYTYTVLAQKEGTFTIPALQIKAGGKKLSTQPLQLKVTGSGGGQTAGAADGSGADTRFAFAEWVLPKTTAYVGEALPAELRLYVDNKVQCQLQQIPSVNGDGFTVQKMGQPQQRQITRDGREFALVIFKTAITPVKAGKLTLPAADINAIAVLPQKRSKMPRMPGFNDLFNEQFLNGMINTPQQVTIRPEAVEMEIKPLPLTGKPADFSGAVGKFTLETKAAPLRIRAGDPVTVTAEVKGIGSFDRMNAPVLADEPGWRAYPPSGKFKADDEAGISGTKTFEMAAIPETAQTELPRLTFSFFNPSTEQYETLTGSRIPLTVDNAPASVPQPPAMAAATPVPSASATPPPVKVNDIQYIRVDSGRWGLSFEPLWRTRTFWLAQLLPFSALLALGGLQWRRTRLANGTVRREARLRQAREEAFRALRREQTSPADFYEAAIRTIQLATALHHSANLEPAAVDAEAACASRPLACEVSEGIRRIFAMHDELRYAGVGSGGSSTQGVHPDQREQVLQILEQFEKSHV